MRHHSNRFAGTFVSLVEQWSISRPHAIIEDHSARGGGWLSMQDLRLFPVNQAEAEPRPGTISTVVIKAVRSCNLRCPYCYYINESTPADHRVISPETLRRLYESVSEYLRGDPRPFSFVWHGGEPTLLGTKRFQSFLDIQREYFKPGQVENALQTNATLITDDWCELFVTNDVKVGVSIDGYQEVHDRNRVTVKGKGSYHKVVEGVKRLQSHGVNVGALMVVDGSADPIATIKSLRDLGMEYCDFLIPMSNNALLTPVVARTQPGGGAARNIGEAYRADYTDFYRVGHFLREAFTELVHNPDPPLIIRLFDSVIKNALGLPHGYLNAGSTNVAENIILEPDGALCLDADFWHIDRFSLGDEYRLKRDIFSADFTFLSLEEGLGRLIADKGLERLPTDCQSCRVRSLCRASHPASRYSSDGSFDHRSAYCEAMYQLCDAIVRYMEKEGYRDYMFDVDLRATMAGR